VAAASSLTGVLEELGADFGDAHPDVRIELTFGASSANAAQVLEGAPVDVVASADAASMDRLVEEDLVSGDVVVLARNRLVVITPPDDPAAIRSLADLADLPGGAHVSLCGRSVPCGRYAAIVLDRAGIDIPEDRVSRGQSAAATTSAVTEGDAVAGIVYATDAAAAGDSVRVVTIPPGLGPLVTYPVAVLEQGGAPDAARAFVEHLTSDEAWPAFERHGFLPPG
jgi:molybdate transport system substrate-binding protein